MAGGGKKSYLGFPCSNCRRPITALTISADMATPEFTRGETVHLPCPHCGHDGNYLLSGVRRFEEHDVH